VSAIIRSGDEFHVGLDDQSREVVTWLLGELRDLLAGGDAHHTMRRLTPPAYHLADDADAEAEYQRLMADELVASRLASIQRTIELLNGNTPLDEAALVGFMQSINAVRLVLGTVLDVSEDDAQPLPDDHPQANTEQLYHFLSWLLQQAVDAIGAIDA
jgi:hypothetical protein